MLTVLVLAASLTQAAEPLKLPEVTTPRGEWRVAGELGELLNRMEAASLASQQVFEPMSAEQMSWQPPNGSHTPRWNVEHMAGVQLRFFSEIYAEIDPDHHKAINLRPKQMPADYEPAHPDWTGKQEAEQMQRISAYILGHAHLLKDLDLDAKAPGSRWKLRALLKRMDDHFAEHTANVVKKFELPGWPSK